MSSLDQLLPITLDEYKEAEKTVQELYADGYGLAVSAAQFAVYTERDYAQLKADISLLKLEYWRGYANATSSSGELDLALCDFRLMSDNLRSDMAAISYIQAVTAPLGGGGYDGYLDEDLMHLLVICHCVQDIIIPRCRKSIKYLRGLQRHIRHLAASETTKWGI